MKNYLLLSLFLITLMLHAQGKYQQGYFIDMNDNRVDCYIKDLDKANTPTQFEYRLVEGGEIITGTIDYVKAFGISSHKKYVRSTVKLDRSLYHTTHIAQFSNEKSPHFEEVTVFLNVLVEGDASLYMYEEGSLRRYFFKTKDTDIYPLVYKKYIYVDQDFGQTDQLRENKEYRQQLYNQVNCGSMQAADMMKIEYKKGELVKHFVSYNECIGKDFINYDQSATQTKININIQAGFSFGALELTGNRWNGDFGDKSLMRLGVEFEVLLPFFRNKLGIIGAINYLNHISERTEIEYQITQNGTSIVMLDSHYKVLEVPIGLRYYFILDNDSKFFVNTSYMTSIALDSKIIRGDDAKIPQLASPTGIMLGGGYRFKNKYGIELQYANRNITYHGPGTRMETVFNTFTILFSYNLL